MYDYRIYDLYQRPVASFAVLADEHANWKPSGYYRSLWHSKTLFRFPVVKILDYAKKWAFLERSWNPFAIVVQAHLKNIGDSARQQQPGAVESHTCQSSV